MAEPSLPGAMQPISGNSSFIMSLLSPIVSSMWPTLPSGIVQMSWDGTAPKAFL